MIDKNVVFLRSNPVEPDPRVEKEVNSLIKAGYNIIILAWDRSQRYKIKQSFLNLEYSNVKIYRFGIPSTFGGGMKSNLRPLFLFQICLVQWLFKNRNQYEIIHACDFDTAFAAYCCSKILNKKLIYDIFDYYVDAFAVPSKIKRIVESMDHQVINAADGVIICTEKRIEQIKGTNARKLTVVHNSPSLSNINNNNLNLNKEKIKIVYVGILQEGRLLKELADIVIKKNELELHIGGFGQLENYFKELSLKHSNIIFYGRLKYSNTIQLENSCDVMTAIYDPTIPNHYYSAPNKFYEALMLGKPLIMVKNTGMDEIISQNNFGEIIDYNIESLKTGIENLIRRKLEWSEISIRMKQLYEREYSWNRMEKRLISLYESI